MTLFESIEAPQRRLNLYRGLVLDVPTWESAHDYHRAQLRTHNLTMHRWGIVLGLEVTAGIAPSNQVVIHPGVAVDASGHTIVVSEPQRLHLDLQEARTVYLVLQYREVQDEMVPVLGGEETQPRFTECHRGHSLQGRNFQAASFFFEFRYSFFDFGCGPSAALDYQLRGDV